MDLSKKAKMFEEEAYEAFEKGRYTFTILFAEQSIQLYIKHILFKNFGDFPKIHNLRVLFKGLNKIRDLSDFIEENSAIIDLLMTAYIEARYTSMEYSKVSAELALKFLEKFKEKIKDLL